MEIAPPSPITEQNALDELCETLSRAPFLVVDTEFQRETTYWPKLCLVQVAAPGVEAMVDPLADGLNINRFLKLLSEPSRLKVMHSARQDQEIFDRMAGAPLAPLFDTQIAAMALGLGDQISYNSFIEQVLGLDIDKSSQFTNWAQRPLQDKQLHYAMGDVTHLREAYLDIHNQLTELNRLHWIVEENNAMCDPKLYDANPEEAWRRLSIRRQHPVYLAVLKVLSTWREEMAQSMDRPRSRILRDDAIQALASSPPDNIEEMANLKPIQKQFLKSDFSAQALELVKDAKADPKKYAIQLDPRRRMNASPQGATDLLKELLNTVAEEHDVTPRLIANVTDLKRLAAGERDVAAMTGWRFDLFGQLALERLATHRDQAEGFSDAI